MADPRLASILDRSGDPATVAWAHAGEGALASLADPELAIAAAGELGNVAALQAVTEPKALRKAAAAALHRIKSRGVRVAEKAPTNSFTLSREVLEVTPRAFLAGPNVLGNCHMVLTASDQEGSCIVELIVGGAKVQDEHGHASRKELRGFWKQMEEDPMMTEVPFIAGLHLADRVVSGKSIHGWSHFMGKVPPATLASARLTDPLRYARPDDGSPAGGWVLPGWCVNAKLVDTLVKSMPGQDETDGWLDAGVAQILEGSARAEFAAAADFAALVFGVLGEGASAADARSVATRLRAGEGPEGFPQLRSALLVAVTEELHHRQTEQQRDIDAIMKRLGNQPRE
ncbi:hypothetical protein LBMAG42_23200 [Deltaproteobacteria bacterium]|nr:hypothetical protein LBMAG42_23200 [Deltaproteobacteria bacterium]